VFSQIKYTDYHLKWFYELVVTDHYPASFGVYRLGQQLAAHQAAIPSPKTHTPTGFYHPGNLSQTAKAIGGSTERIG
jgi:hypothetical protein